MLSCAGRKAGGSNLREGKGGKDPRRKKINPGGTPQRRGVKEKKSTEGVGKGNASIREKNFSAETFEKKKRGQPKKRNPRVVKRREIQMGTNKDRGDAYAEKEKK